MTAQQSLVERVRHALRDRSTREVRMFGGVSFMVEGRMVVAARLRRGAPAAPRPQHGGLELLAVLGSVSTPSRAAAGHAALPP